eukprot:7350875-Prymnesium_polylepis.2
MWPSKRERGHPGADLAARALGAHAAADAGRRRRNGALTPLAARAASPSRASARSVIGMVLQCITHIHTARGRARPSPSRLGFGFLRKPLD